MALPIVVIVGAGAAGVFTAYQLSQQFPGKYDLRLFEAAPTIGGNVSSVSVDYGGQPYVIDAGAQFFYPKAQPNYVNLIQALGKSSDTRQYPAGITIWNGATDQRLFWVPATLSGFASYTLEDWARIIEFGEFFVAAALLNGASTPNWTLTVDDWLSGLPVTDDFSQNVIKNFLYQFVSLPYASIGQASALYAITYFVRNVIGGAAPAGAAQSIGDDPTFQTSQCLTGLLDILQAALTKSGVTAQTSSPVASVAPGQDGVTVVVNGQPTIKAQHVVLACDPGASAALLAGGGTANGNLVALLQGLGQQYLELTVVLQQNGSCWMPGDVNYWEAVNTLADPRQQSVAFSAWFGPLRPPYDTNQPIPVFKSWGAPNLEPTSCQWQFFTHTHDVLLPYVSFVQNRDALVQYQGQNGLFFAGGWTNWFDSQEAALMSAMNIAQWLNGATPTASQVHRVPDAAATSGNVKSWLETVGRVAPAGPKARLADLVKRLP